MFCPLACAKWSISTIPGGDCLNTFLLSLFQKYLNVVLAMPDFLFLLESRLSPDQYRVVEEVQTAAQEQGVHLYLVGGALRDLIYGYPIRDLDFAAEERTEAQFRAAIEAGIIENASAEGLHCEFREMGREESPLEILKALEKEELTTAFHPRFVGSRLNLAGLTQVAKTVQAIEEAGV